MSSDVERLKARACEVIDGVAQDLVEASHAIHGRPELNFEEHFAVETLARVARSNGLEVESGVHGLPTSLRADVGSGPVVCVMSEYDALPEIGHGCGHNVIAAAGLGAALALTAVADDAGGALRYLGTPAEEGGGGKILMQRDGALDGVQLAMMVHSAGSDLTEIDAIALRQVVADYEGREAHAAAAPEMGRNALDAAVLGYLAVAALRQHIGSNERVHGVFTNGGAKPNIVPRAAGTEWYVRSESVESLDSLTERVVAALSSGAMATGCSCQCTYPGETYANLVTNTSMSMSYVANAARLGRRVSNPREGGARVVGSTDMGNISHVVPTIHPMIASAPPGSVIHTLDFARHSRGGLADQAVIDGAKALAMCAIDFWTSEELRRSVRAEFDSAREPRNAS